MIGIEDLRQRHCQGRDERFYTKRGIQAVGDGPTQHKSAEPIHNRGQIHEPLPHRNDGDIGAPNLIDALNRQPLEQIGVYFMPFHGSGYIGLRIYRFQSHEPGQSADAFDIDIVSQRTKVLMKPSYPVIKGCACIAHPEAASALNSFRSQDAV